MNSWPAAWGMRWVKPSMATVSPSCTKAATASRSVVISAAMPRLELDRRGERLARRDQLGQLRRRVLPHEEHRPLRREALVADVAGHGGHVTRPHHPLRPGRPGGAVFDLPG